MRWLLLLSALMIGAGPVLAENLPVPPIPPAHIALADAAPVPNESAEAPKQAVSDAPRVDVRLYRIKMYDSSQGFAPGSRYQSTEERKPIQTPGLSVTVPLK